MQIKQQKTGRELWVRYHSVSLGICSTSKHFQYWEANLHCFNFVYNVPWRLCTEGQRYRFPGRQAGWPSSGISGEGEGEKVKADCQSSRPEERPGPQIDSGWCSHAKHVPQFCTPVQPPAIYWMWVPVFHFVLLWFLSWFAFSEELSAFKQQRNQACQIQSWAKIQQGGTLCAQSVA